MIGEITFDLSAISNYGLIVAAAGYIIVFSALVVLYYVFNNLPKLVNYIIKQRLRRLGKHREEEGDLHISGEVNAAISMALFLYMNELHDEESRTVTIKRISKRYSPWSSKIYSMNNYKR